jgi:hypothetical protein
MAAPARVSEQKLEDRIHRLLKLSSVPEMKQILEEAAELSIAGQHIEAGALVEKAEAISSFPAPQTTAESFIAVIAADLANGLTQVLVRAMQGLERHISISLGESHARLNTDVAALRVQMDELSASLSCRIEEACSRVEAQGREISAIQANASEVASKMAAAAERLERHAAAIRSLHDSHRERTQVFGQMSELLHRMNQGPLSTEGSAL